jgi:hypothetical protein
MMFKPAALLAILLGTMATATAHHSFAIFDRAKQVTLEGTVNKFEFTNPHSWIYMSVATEGSLPQEWAVEALSPNVLSRNGWKRNTLRTGDKIKVLINPARDGSKLGNLILVTLPDGRTLGGGA